jgi:hypothetical protein
MDPLNEKPEKVAFTAHILCFYNRVRFRILWNSIKYF